MEPSGTHRFPRLTMKMVKHYMEVIYGNPGDEGEDIL